MRSICVLAMLTIALSGCYHATVDTGQPASGEVIVEPWAHGFIYGLVPPSTVETAERCPNGVAQVETQLSFLNMLASALTFSLYSPMTIEVQCASAGVGGASAFEIDGDASLDDSREVFTEAVRSSLEQGTVEYVKFE